MSTPTAAFVIPLYNHAATVARVVEVARTLGWPIFVVDDGSTDGGAARVPTTDQVQVLRHPANAGKGAAILTGLRAARAVADYAITVDADGQHDPRDALELLATAETSGRALVVGARSGMDSANVPSSSRFGRAFSGFWVAACGGPRITDSQSGFRAYPIAETLALGTTARRFQFEVEVLVRARWARLPVIEQPVSVAYPPRGERISHFHRGWDSLRNAATFSRLLVLRVLLALSPRHAALPRWAGGSRTDTP